MAWIEHIEIEEVLMSKRISIVLDETDQEAARAVNFSAPL